MAGTKPCCGFSAAYAINALPASTGMADEVAYQAREAKAKLPMAKSRPPSEVTIAPTRAGTRPRPRTRDRTVIENSSPTTANAMPSASIPAQAASRTGAISS
ncbi:hypothetical protein MLP_35530 [Microlunatus phosphovorus NM-1]|uniref:Uncharacterized protein n=1 Tax=Microlunatus phosphovorus (strain ATCC 700054 / DSM 10555 / JCM 9379 / NBRC 101784 / NCIMB 13414 / VKM Ac-1990 / NM-1) TaxID=1032480 RepID=F5XNB7_MICPN|nr:hypothetical protein MLP_35530 [Microlunatus phosphovorus NM-1]